MCKICSCHQYVFKEKQVVFYATRHKCVEPVACTGMAWSPTSQLKIRNVCILSSAQKTCPRSFCFFPFLFGCTTADSTTYIPAKAFGTPKSTLVVSVFFHSFLAAQQQTQLPTYQPKLLAPQSQPSQFLFFSIPFWLHNSRLNYLPTSQSCWQPPGQSHGHFLSNCACCMLSLYKWQFQFWCPYFLSFECLFASL